jgi:hypothetical protein
MLTHVLARRYFALTGAATSEGLRPGAMFAAGLSCSTLVIVAGIVGEGWRHFGQPVRWLA